MLRQTAPAVTASSSWTSSELGLSGSASDVWLEDGAAERRERERLRDRRSLSPPLGEPLLLLGGSSSGISWYFFRRSSENDSHQPRDLLLRPLSPRSWRRRAGPGESSRPGSMDSSVSAASASVSEPRPLLADRPPREGGGFAAADGVPGAPSNAGRGVYVPRERE